MSLWRWVTKSYNDDHSWPYLTTVVAPATFGSVMLIRDVVIPSVRSTRRLTASETAAPVAAALLAIWVLLSTAWSSSRGHTSWHAMIAALVIATAVWFGLALPLRQQLCALFAAMQVATIGSLVAVAIARSARFSPYIGDRSWLGLFGNPNSLGPVSTFAVLTVVGVWPVARGWRWRGCLVLLAAADVVVAAYATCYTAWLALIASLAVIGSVPLVRRLGSVRHCGTWCVAAAGALLLAAAAAVPITRQVAQWFGKDSTFGGRTVVWRYTVDAARAHRIGGFGFGVFWDDPVNQFRYMSTTGRDWVASSHSTFVDGLIYLGATGVVLIVTVAGISLVRSYRAAIGGRTPGAEFWAAVAAFALVENVAESMMGLHSVFWMLLIVPGFAVAQRSELTTRSRTVLRTPAQGTQAAAGQPV